MTEEELNEMKISNSPFTNQELQQHVRYQYILMMI